MAREHFLQTALRDLPFLRSHGISNFQRKHRPPACFVDAARETKTLHRAQLGGFPLEISKHDSEYTRLELRDPTGYFTDARVSANEDNDTALVPAAFSSETRFAFRRNRRLKVPRAYGIFKSNVLYIFSFFKWFCRQKPCRASSSRYR